MTPTTWLLEQPTPSLLRRTNSGDCCMHEMLHVPASSVTQAMVSGCWRNPISKCSITVQRPRETTTLQTVHNMQW